MPIPGPIAQVQPLQATQPTNAMTPGWPGAPNIQQGGPIGQAMPIPGPIAQVQPLQATQPTTSMTPGLPGAPKIQEGGPIGQAMPIPDPVAQVQPLQATPVPARVTHGEQGLAVPKVPHVVVPKPKAVIVPAAPMSKAQAPAPPEMLNLNTPPRDGPKHHDDGDEDRRRLADRQPSRTRSRSGQAQRFGGRSRSRSRRSRSRSWGRRRSSGFDAEQQEEQKPAAGLALDGVDLVQFSNGEDVDVRYNQLWYGGKVVRMGMNGNVLVCVDGAEYSVDAKDLRRKAPEQAVPPVLQPQQHQALPRPGQRQEESLKGKGIEDSSKGKGKGKGKSKTKKGLVKSASSDIASCFCVGALVEAYYRGNWYEGKVVRLTSPDKAIVQVDGSEYEMDITEVKHVTRGGGLCVGKDVEVNYRGKWFDSQISAFMDGGKVKVRYEGDNFIVLLEDIRARSAVRQSEDVEMSGPQKLQRTSKWSDSRVQSREDLLADLKNDNQGSQATDGESTPPETYLELSAKAAPQPPMQPQIRCDDSRSNMETGDTQDATLGGGALSQVFRSKAPPAKSRSSAPMPTPALPPSCAQPSAPAEDDHSADDMELQTEMAAQSRPPVHLPKPGMTQKRMLPAACGKSGWMPRPKHAPQFSQFQEEPTDEQQPLPKPSHQTPLQQEQPSPQPSQQSGLALQDARRMPGVRPKFGGSTSGESGDNAPRWMPKAKSPALLPRPSSVDGGGFACSSAPLLPQPRPRPRAAA
eukprot:TRINITY_DN1223_c0_g1_i3.p1 TRINITY_DN1223_c0_g1~~TRINITY_DN1223_c0_g1_i3.p1  ORF type:complete len:746 (-),score=125.69 TRINITY_DN1223_c0_g1_i3:92-2329(-)